MEEFLLNKFSRTRRFYVCYSAEFIELIQNDSKVRNEKSQTIEKNNKESNAKQSKIGLNALTHSKVFEQAKSVVGYTFENKDIGMEQKENKREFLETETE